MKKSNFNFKDPKKVFFTEDEKKMGKCLVEVQKEINDSKDKDNNNSLTLNNLNIKDFKDNKFIFLMGTPIDKAPFESVLMGTLNNGYMDINLIEFILNKWGVNTVKSDFSKLGKILEGNNNIEKDFLRKGNYFISSLPPVGESNFYDLLDKQGLKHINTGAYNKISDLFYTYQAFKNVGANQPKTAFLQTDDIFKNIQDKTKLKDFIIQLLKESGINDISEKNPVFIRSGISSFKNLDKYSIDKSESFNLVKNIFRYIGYLTINKIKKISFQNLLKGKEDNLSEEDLKIKITNEIKTSGYGDILETLEKEKQYINNYENIIDNLKNESTLDGGKMQGIDKFKFTNIDSLIDFLDKNLLHIISARLLTNSGIAIREYIDVNNFEYSDKTKYQVPLSSDYRCIINNGELMNVTTWTPYNSIDTFNEDIFQQLKLNNDEILEINNVAKKFSKETGLKSFTLDVMKGKDGKLYFYEINRLEHSHMSHIKTRIILAYENACRLSGKEVNNDELNNFINIFKDKVNFEKVFYSSFFQMLENLNKSGELDGLIKIHKNSMDNDFRDFIEHDVIWNKYK